VHPNVKEWASATVAVALVAGAVLACGGGGPPSKVKGVPTVAPDESYQLGAVGHQEGFIWNCTDAGEHVHLARGCGEYLGCGRWSLERGACGAKLAAEPPASDRKPMQYNRWE
jgi:hypothetical protein